MWPDVDDKNESFGDYLRREREYRHITLDELSKATKIRKFYLDAIERDEYKLLPGGSYLKGFVRSYAKYIGIDPDDTILRLESYLKQYEAKKTPVPVKQTIKKSTGIYIIVAIAGILILIALAGVMKKEKKIETVKEVKKTEIVQKKEPVVTVQPETKTDVLSPEQQKNEKLRLTIKAKEKTWVMVKRDNEKPFDVILWEGDVANWYAEERISLRIGNAQGVEITYNGIPLKNLGAKGEVVGIILPEDLSKFQ
jgi:transcriptional regulator with XRE-family HTH domain